MQSRPYLINELEKRNVDKVDRASYPNGKDPWSFITGSGLFLRALRPTDGIKVNLRRQANGIFKA